MKKLLSILLVVAMVAAMALTVSAAETATFTVSSATAAIGEEVSLTVSAKGSFATYALSVTWDAEALELVSLKDNKMYLGSFTGNTDNGFVTEAVTANEDIDGTLFTITFKVLKAGEHKVNLAVENAVLDDGKTYLTTAVNAGTITVEAPACEHKNTEKIPGKAATCTEDGLTEGLKCADCGTIITAQEVIKATGHKMAKPVAPAAYDCDKGYTVEVACENGCGHKENVTVEGHKHETTKVVLERKWEEVDGVQVQFALEQDVCSHKDDHGCSYATEPVWVEISRPTTGDITPYIVMSVVTLVGLAAAAAYLTLKRKAV